MKKISINKMQNIIKENIEHETKTDFYGSELIVKRMICLDDMVGFVNSTVDACFGGENKKYIPDVKDFAIKSNIFEYYTNISLTDNMKERYEMVYDMWNLAGDTIMHIIDAEQYKSICDAIDKKIENIVDCDVDYIYSKVNEVVDVAGKIYKYFDEVFSGISKEDVEAMSNAVINSLGKIDEGKIVDAILAHRNK